MSRNNRRLALRASIEKSRARGLEAISTIHRLDAMRAERRIDALASAGDRVELDRAFRVAALTHPSVDQTR